MREEMGLDWPEIAQIFRRMFNINAAVKWVRDDYNNRDKAGRSQMWAQHIIKAVYTPQEQSDRAAVRADIISAANALNIQIPNANAPVAAPVVPAAAIGVQPVPTSNTQSASTNARVATTGTGNRPASSALPNTTTSTLRLATTTSNMVSSHGLGPRSMTPANRFAPTSSKPRRPGLRFVLAGYPDPQELQEARKPPAKRPVTAERVHASRALPPEQSRDLTYGPRPRFGFMFGAGSQSSRPDPQGDVSDGVSGASKSPRVSPDSDRDYHISPPMRVAATFSPHSSHDQAAARVLKPTDRQKSARHTTGQPQAGGLCIHSGGVQDEVHPRRPRPKPPSDTPGFRSHHFRRDIRHSPLTGAPANEPYPRSGYVRRGSAPGPALAVYLHADEE
ncbi:hypothetical protein AC578_6560 [Pseudocercospora eumusae]|uniref:Uncharacterized protein n=1 Tax=Pseudocercospora eumusae TaxID=321146 RepID=A0A139HHR8_9PEZI|nr:hypothetical protein AC578_6560 [Pseudocercospora eumusae]